MRYYYTYHTARGKAVMAKSDSQGGDDYPLKPLGQFHTEAEAKRACQDHFRKACDAARKFCRPEPQAFWA